MYMLGRGKSAVAAFLRKNSELRCCNFHMPRPDFRSVSHSTAAHRFSAPVRISKPVCGSFAAAATFVRRHEAAGVDARHSMVLTQRQHESEHSGEFTNQPLSRARRF